MSGWMTAAEIHERLADGEFPIDLSIDKWRRICNNPAIGDYNKHQLADLIDCETCALCVTYDCGPSAQHNICPFQLIWGYDCEDLWSDVCTALVDATTMAQWQQAAHRMIGPLERIMSSYPVNEQP